jgi:uncharacterized protein YgfB (UPF0149 family)
MSESVDFHDVARALSEAGSTVLAAEAHGYLCGALCVHRDFSLAEWLDEILPDGSTADHGRFESLRETSDATLSGTEMEFQPLLPDDEEPLAVRSEALGAWCQGFLYGFGAAGTANRSVLPESVSEFLADLARISQAGDVGSEAEEAEEAAYAELVEFLRVGVQLVYDELAALRAGQPAALTNH